MTLGDITNRKDLPALTGLRAVLVGLVVLYHAGLPLPAGLGVTGFFVLSGFLITWLLLRELDESGDISIRAFYWRRSLRIFPAYYAFLALSIGADLTLGNREIEPAILPGLFYGMNYFNAVNDHPSLSIAHAWSLAVEEQFYLLWPVMFLFIAKRGRKILPWALGGLIVLVMIWRSVAYYWLGTAWAYNAFDTRADSLATGCLLAVLLPHLRGMRGYVVAPVVLCALIMLADQWRYTVGFTLSALLIGLLLLQMMLLSRHPLWRWIESRPAVYIGTISYGIYLYHVFALSAGGKLGSVWAGVALSIGMAAVSYHVWERPFSRLRHWRFREVPAQV